VTLVDYKILMERWPYRSQPTINRRMRELEDAGQVRRVSTKRFAAAKWQIVALVTSVSA
jgi:DNA-binding HxlR family transcriptional regulator